MKDLFKTIIIICVIWGIYCLGKANGDPNQKMIYGETGLPRNCRAIIDANIKGWQQGTYTANDALTSIDRNCGAIGYSWGLK